VCLASQWTRSDGEQRNARSGGGKNLPGVNELAGGYQDLDGERWRWIETWRFEEGNEGSVRREEVLDSARQSQSAGSVSDSGGR
jgi:hypothetical protein